MTEDPAIAWDRLRWDRTPIEVLAIVLCAVLGVSMGGFLLADWLRSVLPVAAVVFEQYLVVGQWIDYLLGTRVFWVPSVWRALATGVYIGIAAPLIGVFLIHRQMALIGETLAHTAFAGLAAGVVLVGITGWAGSLVVIELGSHGALLFVALLVSALGALGLNWLVQRSATYGDVPIAIVLSGSFAVGTVLISWARTFAPISVDVEGILFGSLAIVTAPGARLVMALTVVVVVLVWSQYRPLFFVTFDAEAAEVAGMPVERTNTLLVVLTAVVVVGSMQILGVILVAAMLVVPAAAASQVASSFRQTVWLSLLFGQAAVLVGLGIAVIWGHPPGGSIVLVAISGYLAAVARGDRPIGRIGYR